MVLKYSTPQEIKKGVKKIFTILDHDSGGFISGTSNSIMPDTPFENIETLLETMEIYSDRKKLGKFV